MNETGVTVSLLLDSMTAIGAVGAALAAGWAARQTMKAAEAQIYTELKYTYATDKMLASLKTLANWHNHYGEQFCNEYLIQLKGKKAEALNVDDARRYVKYYFLNLLDLHDLGLIRKKIFFDLCDVDGRNLLFNIVEPLEISLDPESKSKPKLDKLRRVFPPDIGPVKVLPNI